MLARFRGQFRNENLKIIYFEHQAFVTCRWQRDDLVHPWYLVYRLLYLTYIATFLYCFMRDPCFDYRAMAYVTIWTAFLWFIQALAAVVAVTVAYIDQNYNNMFIRHPIIFGLYWVFFCTYSDICIAITAMYWGLVHFDGDHHPLNFYNIGMHVLNFCLPFIDFFIVAVPVKLLHCYTTSGYTLVYLVFNLLYCKFGGTDLHGNHYLYVVMDWNKDYLGSLFMSIAVIPMTLVLRLLTFLCYILRTYIYERCYSIPQQ